MAVRIMQATVDCSLKPDELHGEDMIWETHPKPANLESFWAQMEEVVTRISQGKSDGKAEEEKEADDEKHMEDEKAVEKQDDREERMEEEGALKVVKVDIGERNREDEKVVEKEDDREERMEEEVALKDDGVDIGERNREDEKVVEKEDDREKGMEEESEFAEDEKDAKEKADEEDMEKPKLRQAVNSQPSEGGNASSSGATGGASGGATGGVGTTASAERLQGSSTSSGGPAGDGGPPNRRPPARLPSQCEISGLNEQEEEEDSTEESEAVVALQTSGDDLQKTAQQIGEYYASAGGEPQLDVDLTDDEQLGETNITFDQDEFFRRCSRAKENGELVGDAVLWLTSGNLDVHPDDRGQYRPGKEFLELEFLGEGTYGYVVRIEDVASHKEFALKRVPLRDFRREELETCSTIQAQGIVAVYAAILQAGEKTVCNIVSMVQQLIPNTSTLERAVADNWCWTLDAVFQIFIDLLRALTALHGSSITHGDLHMGNVLITEHFQAYLIDFGMSQHHTAEHRFRHAASMDVRFLCRCMGELFNQYQVQKVPFGDACKTKEEEELEKKLREVCDERGDTPSAEEMLTCIHKIYADHTGALKRRLEQGEEKTGTEVQNESPDQVTDGGREPEGFEAIEGRGDTGLGPNERPRSPPEPDQEPVQDPSQPESPAPDSSTAIQEDEMSGEARALDTDNQITTMRQVSRLESDASSVHDSLMSELEYDLWNCLGVDN